MYVAVLIFPPKKTCKFTQYSNAYSLFNIIEFHISEYMFLSLKTRWKNKYNELKHDTWLDMFCLIIQCQKTPIFKDIHSEY